MVIDGANLMAGEMDSEEYIRQLQQEIADLRHDLNMVLERPVFRPTGTPAPHGTKLLIRPQPGNICMTGYWESDVTQWALLPMSFETFTGRRKSLP